MPKSSLKDVVDWRVRAEPGGKPDKFGRLNILHIIKLRSTLTILESPKGEDTLVTHGTSFRALSICTNA